MKKLFYLWKSGALLSWERWKYVLGLNFWLIGIYFFAWVCALTFVICVPYPLAYTVFAVWSGVALIVLIGVQFDGIVKITFSRRKPIYLFLTKDYPDPVRPGTMRWDGILLKRSEGKLSAVKALNCLLWTGEGQKKIFFAANEHRLFKIWSENYPEGIAVGRKVDENSPLHVYRGTNTRLNFVTADEVFQMIAPWNVVLGVPAVEAQNEKAEEIYHVLMNETTAQKKMAYTDFNDSMRKRSHAYECYVIRSAFESHFKALGVMKSLILVEGSLSSAYYLLHVLGDKDGLVVVAYYPTNTNVYLAMQPQRISFTLDKFSQCYTSSALLILINGLTILSWKD